MIKNSDGIISKKEKLCKYFHKLLEFTRKSLKLCQLRAWFSESKLIDKKTAH